MTGKLKRNIILSLLLLVLLAGSVGYYLYNKGPVDVKNSSAQKANAAELYVEFNKDSSASIKKYSGKIVLVTGEVSSVTPNQKKEKIILLKTNSDGAFINCTMEEDPGEIKLKGNISIKGICSGIGQGDADLGIKGDVYLTRCFLVK